MSTVNKTYEFASNVAAGKCMAASELAKEKKKGPSAKKIFIGLVAALAMLMAGEPAWAICDVSGSINANISCIDADVYIHDATIITSQASNSIRVANNIGTTTITIKDTTVQSLFGNNFLLAMLVRNGINFNFSGTNNFTLGSHAQANTALNISSQSGGAAVTGDTVVNVNGILNITNSALEVVMGGYDRDALEISSFGTGSAQLTHNGAGKISTVDGNAAFVRAQGISGDVIINMQGSGAGIDLVTASNSNVQPTNLAIGTHGISASITNAANTGGKVTVTTNDKVRINTSGDYSYGIYTQAQGGDITVKTKTAITTLGESAHGIYAETTGAGGIGITAAGAVTATGDDSHGIKATIRGTGSATVNYSNGLVQAASSAVYVGDDNLGTGTQGIINLGANATVRGNSDYALQAMVGGGNTITTHASSRIEGA